MKMILKYIALLLFLSDRLKGDQLSSCGLAQILVKTYSIAKEDVANYICMAQWESGFDMSCIGISCKGGFNPDKKSWRSASRDVGIFQVNDYWNCINSTRKATDPMYRSKNGCNVECSLLLTDMDEDVSCIKQLYKEHHQSYDFSYAWKKHCKDKDLTPYIKGCNLDGNPNLCTGYAQPPDPFDCAYLCRDKDLGYNCCQSMDEVIFTKDNIVSTCYKSSLKRLNRFNPGKGKQLTWKMRYSLFSISQSNEVLESQWFTGFSAYHFSVILPNEHLKSDRLFWKRFLSRKIRK